MLIGRIDCLVNLNNRLRQISYSFLSQMDFLFFFAVAFVLWVSYVPYLSKSRHLPQVEIPIFNESLVVDSKFMSNLKGNFLSYLYAPWDAGSLRHINDVDLFISASFGLLPVTAFSCWKAPCANKYPSSSFPRLIWSHAYGLGVPDSFDRFPKMLHKAKRIYKPLIQINSCAELMSTISSFEFTIVGRMEASSRPSNMFLQFHELATRVFSGHDTLVTSRFTFSLSRDFAFVIMSTKTDACSLDTTVPINIVFLSGKSATPLSNFPYSNAWSVDDMLKSLYTKVKEMVENYKESNLLLLPHLSTAFPTPNNISGNSPLILLFTDSHLEPGPSNDLDVYIFRSVQLEYSICQSKEDSDADAMEFLPKLSDQQHIIYKRLLTELNERCRTAIVCPIWWRKANSFSSHSLDDSWLSCGLNKSTLPHSNNKSFTITSQIIPDSLQNHSARDDLISLASHLLNSDIDPYETPAPTNNIDGVLAVSNINRRCCEFAVIEATNMVGVFDTARIRGRALSLVRGRVRPQYNRSCVRTDVVNYARVRTPSIEALGCRRWGNDSLTFFTVSAHNPPPWVEVLLGSKDDLPRVSIVDSKSEIVYAMEGNLSYANLVDFITRFHNGTLERRLYSKMRDRRWKQQEEDTLLRHAHSAVELESLIGLEAKDVVVLFYGRHCGYTTHGRGALYEFRSVAGHFANRESLLFVVVDIDTVQLPWHLTVEFVPVIILFPSNRKSNSIVFPQAILASSDLYSELVNFLNKHTSANTSKNTSKDSFNMSRSFNVHISRINAAEHLLDSVLQRLVIGLEELNDMINREIALRYFLTTTSGRLVLDRLIFTREKLSSQWRRFVDSKDRFIKERNVAKAAQAHLPINNP